jgi:hypothetical protein
MRMNVTRRESLSHFGEYIEPGFCQTEIKYIQISVIIQNCARMALSQSLLLLPWPSFWHCAGSLIYMLRYIVGEFSL